MLYLIRRKYKSKKIGLDRDDGLSVFRTSRAQKSKLTSFRKTKESFIILVQVKRLANYYTMQLEGRKIFNKNNLKLSCSYIPNLKAKIDGNKKKIFQKTPPPKAKTCNCLKKENCPVKEACFTENVLYYAKISCEDVKYKPKLHKGICETTFKKRYVKS